ncbi:MAG: hypothetical protein KC478_00250 [Bacteriovoracaceae bacterium]|nr:hypothetical protein [Bacteriovoracaceae bacterium]
MKLSLIIASIASAVSINAFAACPTDLNSSYEASVKNLSQCDQSERIILMRELENRDRELKERIEVLQDAKAVYTQNIQDLTRELTEQDDKHIFAQELKNTRTAYMLNMSDVQINILTKKLEQSKINRIKDIFSTLRSTKRNPKL